SIRWPFTQFNLHPHAAPGGQSTLVYVDIRAHKNWTIDLNHPSAPVALRRPWVCEVKLHAC
ncbi:MAG: hypothetical protein WBL61_07840, partial [Bryobacteraceae bacterium]